LPRPLLDLSRALSAVSQVCGRTGLKTRDIISDILSALYENQNKYARAVRCNWKPGNGAIPCVLRRLSSVPWNNVQEPFAWFWLYARVHVFISYASGHITVNHQTRSDLGL